MKDMVRASDITEALTTIRVLNDKVAKLSGEVSKWKLNIECKVLPNQNGGYDVEVLSTVGSNGLREIITASEIILHDGAYDDLARDIVRHVVDQLINDRAEAEFMPELVKAFRNVEKITGK